MWICRDLGGSVQLETLPGDEEGPLTKRPRETEEEELKLQGEERRESKVAGDETARRRRQEEQDRERRVEEYEVAEDERARQQWQGQQRRRCEMAEVEEECQQTGRRLVTDERRDCGRRRER